MASIPLPALDVRTPPQQNPADLLSLAMNLKQKQALMPGQLALQQQQVEAGSLENQRTTQAIQDQQAQTAAWKEWNKKDVNDLPDLVLKHGGSAAAAASTTTALTKQMQDAANLTKDQIANELSRNDQLMGHIDAIKGIADPDQRAAQAKLEASRILQSPGLIKDPQTLQMVQGMAQGQMVPTDDQLDMFEKGLVAHKQGLENAKTVSETNKNTEQAGEATAQTNKLNAEMAFYKNKGIAPGVPLDVQEAQDWLSKNQGKSMSDFMKYKATLIPAYNFNLQNGGTGGGPNGQPNPMAAAIAKGDMKWNDAVSARTPMSVKQSLLAQVKAINPSYNSGDFDVEKQAKITATSGTVGQQLLAIGTAREHMKLFSQLADALDNSDVQLANKLGNAIGIQFGNDKATNLKIASQAFGGEVGRAFDGAGVVAGEREEAQKAFSDQLSKGQFKGAVKTVDALLAGKQKAAHAWFDQASQAKPDFGNEQPAQNQGGGVSVKAPNGKTYTFKDQASADAFKKNANIQ